jgi:hypothetical protein
MSSRRSRKRRQFDADDVEAVIEVGAEFPLIGQRLQVFLGGGDDPAGDGNQLVGAEPFDDPFLQDAQQLDLHGHRHRLDFIEEQGAAAGVFDLADAPFLGAGEGAGFVAEEFAVEQAVGHAAAVERDVIFLPGAGQVVQAAGDHFLAGAGFAERSARRPQHSATSRINCRNLGHLRRAADQRASRSSR